MVSNGFWPLPSKLWWSSLEVSVASCQNLSCPSFVHNLWFSSYCIVLLFWTAVAPKVHQTFHNLNFFAGTYFNGSAAVHLSKTVTWAPVTPFESLTNCSAAQILCLTFWHNKSSIPQGRVDFRGNPLWKRRSMYYEWRNNVPGTGACVLQNVYSVNYYLNTGDRLKKNTFSLVC